MTQEDKELLLKDLCARLPYGVIFKDEFDENLQEIHYIKNEDIFSKNYSHLPYWIETIKPYLRPMSSMTEEERNLIRKYCDEHDRLIYDIGVSGQAHSKNIVDWLNAHHFDYRNLIEKGLAIEVTENNNPYKE